MADQRSDQPAAPQVETPRLEQLTPGVSGDLSVDDDDLENLHFRDLSFETLRLAPNRILDGIHIDGLRVGHWETLGSRLVESILERVEAPGVHGPRSHFTDVEIRQSRLGSAELYEADWRSVHFVGCKIGFLNLRGAQLRDVAFTDCTIDDLDVMGATAARVDFTGTRIGRLDVHGATMTDVDLRGAELREIVNLAGLTGVTITHAQLLLLAPLLASHLGLRVVE